MAWFGIMTSVQSARPGPSARGRRFWLTTAWIVNESWARICDCWCDGKTSMMRLMDEMALLVWSVAKTKWPVSEMVMAASMVSRSRISPMRTTSGSWRRAYFSAAVKDAVSMPTVALVDHGELVRVQVLDRVFDRHDVQALFGV
jgi:hypothetical protein